MPFLTIFLRQLGLSAPLVGILIGTKHLIYVFWAPLGSYLAKTSRKRRILIMMSLILSAGAGIILTIYPPINKDIISKHCNSSHLWTDNLPNTATLGVDRLKEQDSNSSLIKPESPSTTPHITSPPVEMQRSPITAMEALVPVGTVAHLSITSTPLEISTPDHRETSPESEKKFRTTSGIIGKLLDNLTGEYSSSTKALHDRTDIPKVGNDTDSSPEASDKPVPKREVRDVNLDLQDQAYLFIGEYKNFLIALGVLILWEVTASPLEWTADDSLYEYLDFVDATDRHGKLRVFSHLGACVGSTFIALLIDHLDCFFIADIPRVYLHLYGYSAFIIVTLLLSPLFPVHVSKKSEHANKTIKALGLVVSDGRAILLAITVFLTGAVGSTVQNFLFWKMEDMGSTELYMGLTVTIALLSEIALLAFKEKILKALLYKWTVVVGLGCMAVQFLYYSFLWTPWAVLPIQLLSAFSNGALWWAALSQIENVATPGTERSLQLVLHCLSYGCGAGIGSFASGFIIHRFSLEILYQACAAAIFLWAILFLLVHPKLPHIKKINYSRLLAADQSDASDSDEEHDRDWLVEAMKDENKMKKW